MTLGVDKLNKEKLPSAVEMPVELWVNEVKITTFMCTPYDLEDLAIGHLLTRGMISDISKVKDVTVNEDTYQIFLNTTENVSHPLYSVPEFVLSGASAVGEFSDNIYKIPSINSDYTVELEKIVDIAHTMIKEAIIYNTTGGVHGAVISNASSYFLREDIGRHNAVDKAVGAAARQNIDFFNSFICTTGRISLDMLLKSAAIRIPVVASLKYPSDMGVRLANHYNIAIVSRITSNEPSIYANEERIILNK